MTSAGSAPPPARCPHPCWPAQRKVALGARRGGEWCDLRGLLRVATARHGLEGLCCPRINHALASQHRHFTNTAPLRPRCAMPFDEEDEARDKVRGTRARNAPRQRSGAEPSATRLAGWRVALPGRTAPHGCRNLFTMPRCALHYYLCRAGPACARALGAPCALACAVHTRASHAPRSCPS